MSMGFINHVTPSGVSGGAWPDITTSRAGGCDKPRATFLSSSPLMPGIKRSVRSRSTGAARSRESAHSAPSHVSTEWPSALNSRLMTLRTPSSSSTTSTLNVMGAAGCKCWQLPRGGTRRHAFLAPSRAVRRRPCAQARDLRGRHPSPARTTPGVVEGRRTEEQIAVARLLVEPLDERWHPIPVSSVPGRLTRRQFPHCKE